MAFDDMGTETAPGGVTITGTRDTGHRPLADYAAMFEEFIRPFASPGTVFYLGGAVGIDSLALLWLAKETRVRLVVVVPAALADQPGDAQNAVKTVQEQRRLGELVELGLETRTAGYHARNRWMVDRSSFVIGFPPSGAEAGGTGYTLDYAKEHCKPRLVVPV